MKAKMTVLMVVLMVGGASGCGKTLNELKVNADAAVDNTAQTGSEMLYVLKGVVKKIIGIGKAVYDIGSKAVEDSTDNAVTVKDTVVGVTK